MTEVNETQITENLYVVYGLEDPRDSLYHYIGITNDVYRRFDEHLSGRGANNEKHSWITECRQAKVMVVMREIERVSTQEEALNREKHWMDHYLTAGHPLHNIWGVKARTLPQKPLQERKLVRKKKVIYAGVFNELEQERKARTISHMYPLTLILVAVFTLTFPATVVLIAGAQLTHWLWLAMTATIVGSCCFSALSTLLCYMSDIAAGDKHLKEIYAGVSIIVQTPRELVPIVTEIDVPDE